MKKHIFTIYDWIHLLSIIVLIAVTISTTSFIKGIFAAITMEVISWLILKLTPVVWYVIFKLIWILYLCIMLVICSIIYVITFGGKLFGSKNQEENTHV